MLTHLQFQRLRWCNRSGASRDVWATYERPGLVPTRLLVLGPVLGAEPERFTVTDPAFGSFVLQGAYLTVSPEFQLELAL